MGKNLITFGELLKIKREAMGYTLKEAATYLGYSNICAVERGVAYPRPSRLKKIQDKYKITNEEIKACKDGEAVYSTQLKRAQSSPTPTIENLIQQLEALIEGAKSLKLKGRIGESINNEVIACLQTAKSNIADADILDKLL